MTREIATAGTLLRNIRDIMASPEPAQGRLDRLVHAIAKDFSSEVCSIYLLRAGDILELFASVGLNQKAVHLTRLQVGQGLVGTVAVHGEPLNLADAKSHPEFVYRPETGEEIYRSFVGVPILYGRRVIGVLVVQGAESQSYTGEQVEVLQTVAMVLAELIAARRMLTPAEWQQSETETFDTLHLTGQRLSPGLARAAAVLHRQRIEISKIVSDDSAHEEERLQNAIRELQDSVDVLIHRASGRGDTEQREIMEAYRMFARDRGWLAQLAEAVSTGLTAEAAVRKVQDQLHARMTLVSSEYIRERIRDLEDLSSRLIGLLSGDHGLAGSLPEQFILIAESLGPAELLNYDGDKLCGIVLEEGSATSHIAIIARAMDIPLVGQVAGATEKIAPGEIVVVDGDSGEVFIRPSEQVDEAVSEHLRANRAKGEHYAASQHLPPITRDGVRISLNLNVGLIADPRHLIAQDVDGIGLYRSELPYMVASDFPDVASQERTYQKILEQANGKPVVFRSFDIGGDKQVSYLQAGVEENPAMGWRATRIALDRPAILCRQFRAFIQAGRGKALSVMFPFIAEVAELDATREIFDGELSRAREEGIAPMSVRIGAMIEIPSILYQLSELMQRVDFVSIGSNDLLQFLFACDRGTQKVADRYDALSPVVLGIVRNIVREGEKAGVEVGFCGEMARHPLEAMALLAVGIRNLSMPHSAIGPVKEMIRSLKLEDLRQYADYIGTLPEHSLRTRLVEFAHDHRIPL